MISQVTLNKRMFSQIVVFIAVVSSFMLYSNSACSMQLLLFRQEKNILVYLLNNSDESKIINKRFSIGSRYGVSTEIAFIVRNFKGQIKPFRLSVTAAPIKASDYIILKPNNIVGEIISIKKIANRYFKLESGQYRLMAVYRNKDRSNPSAFNEVLESNEITIDIE